LDRIGRNRNRGWSSGIDDSFPCDVVAEDPIRIVYDNAVFQPL